ncbi:MAG: hypothetical protein BGO12_13435 [Verrucomicrobia bacterium 61-8]|nr:MAG: hypothetical protein BGO12_13435 [Verrucomicrobia bacterium 61-8]
MKEILGKAKTIRELLGGAKYSIDYYQREYRWQTKQITELVEDLAAKFLESHEAVHDRTDVENYGHYFLGSIIISDRDGQKYIIDGQQRLTSLTLLLIYLHRHLEDEEEKGQMADLIFSRKHGRRSFNLDVPDRTPCMDALYTGQPFDPTDQPESVVNILGRFEDIADEFPDEIGGTVLPFFADWLIENVHLVEITAYSDEDAYTIFETMNDRGLSLTPTDMLKGYLLANITTESTRSAASKVWKERIAECQDWGKEEDADAIKAWLRSQHAQKIRERKRNAKPEDFDLIGTEFHRWIRDHEEGLGLTKSSEFARFIERDFKFYTAQYLRTRWAGWELTPGLESIHFNTHHNFTLQYSVLLAPLLPDDPEAEILRKLHVVSTFIDILITRRIWNWRAIDYSTLQYAMFNVIRDIRGRSAADTAAVLAQRLADDQETFAKNERFAMHGTNGRQIHRVLARMTDFVETHSGMASRYAEYMATGKKRYEIEHIWANHPERHNDEFSHPSDFASMRNRIGGLLLLPKSFNASYGDLTYEQKLPHYHGQNLLARSLHSTCYENNPGFLRFIEATGLPFKPMASFKSAEMEERCALYLKLAEHIWNPTRVTEAATA